MPLNSTDCYSRAFVCHWRSNLFKNRTFACRVPVLRDLSSFLLVFRHVNMHELSVQAKGIARRLTPILMGVREEVKEDMYTLVRTA